MKTCQVEIWLLVDADGNYVATHDEAELGDSYENCIGTLAEAAEMGCRRVKVTLTVPLPVTTELTGTVPPIGEPSELVAS